MFEHRVMAKASDRILDAKAFPFHGEDGEVVRAAEMFAIWQTIRHEKIVQDFLVSLIIRPRS